MARESIADVVVTVLAANKAPMSAKEIYDSIIARQLYEFKAKDPFAILQAQLNKHCVENQSKGRISSKAFYEIRRELRPLLVADTMAQSCQRLL